MNTSSTNIPFRPLRAAISSLFLLTLAVVSGPLPARAEAPQSEAKPTAAAKTIRLLTIGNSFSANATKYLGDLAKAGGKQLIHRPIVVGGAPLDLHAGKFQANERDPKDKAGLYANGKSLKQELTSDKWDVVTIQQASIKSHDLSTYEPYAEQLRDYVRQNAPQAELVIHETWEYRVDDPRFTKPSDKAGEPKTQEEMYQSLKAAYTTTATKLGVRLFPVGDAFHLVNNDPKWGFHAGPVVNPKAFQAPALPDQKNSLNMGWQWKKQKDGTTPMIMDGHHANVAGQYLGACVWYEMLFGESVVGNQFAPPGIDADYARFLQESAHRAVEQLPAEFKKAPPLKKQAGLSSPASKGLGMARVLTITRS